MKLNNRHHKQLHSTVTTTTATTIAGDPNTPKAAMGLRVTRSHAACMEHQMSLVTLAVLAALTGRPHHYRASSWQHTPQQPAHHLSPSLTAAVPATGDWSTVTNSHTVARQLGWRPSSRRPTQCYQHAWHLHSICCGRTSVTACTP